MKKSLTFLLPISILCTACATSNGLPAPSGRHISVASAVAGNIPALAKPIPVLPKPQASTKLETYSVVVSQLAVSDLLFALARDAKINVDVSPGVTGSVTLNAINQTLPQILDRIARQVDIRWSMENGVLSVVPDAPMLKTYHIDYFNLSRNMKATLNVINSVKSVSDSGGGNGSSSSTLIESENQNQFWKRLEGNLKELLGVRADATVAAPSVVIPAQAAAMSQQAAQKIAASNTDAKTTLASADQVAKLDKTIAQTEKVQAETAALQQTASAQMRAPESNLVIINPETGVITIRASNKDQLKVADFLANIQAAAQRQVLIEATIVEVALGDQYQAGVDWSQIASGAGWSFGQSLLGTNLATAPLSLISYKSNDFSATVKMLEQFGKTRVLSSPKIIALNNQTAVMKVVEEQVYFTIKVTPGTVASAGVPGIAATYESELHTVPVGLVMQVTPQIAEFGAVSMNVRPTITNISSYVDDPAVAIVAANSGSAIKSLIPVLQVREFDSTLKIASGQVAVLGGLIQDKQSNNRQGIPGLSRIPVLGDVFSYRDDNVRKIELVVFLRPILVKENGLDGDLAAYRQYLPSNDYFNAAQDQNLSAYHSGVVPLPPVTGAQR